MFMKRFHTESHAKIALISAAAVIGCRETYFWEVIRPAVLAVNFWITKAIFRRTKQRYIARTRGTYRYWDQVR